MFDINDEIIINNIKYKIIKLLGHVCIKENSS